MAVKISYPPFEVLRQKREETGRSFHELKKHYERQSIQDAINDLKCEPDLKDILESLLERTR